MIKYYSMAIDTNNNSDAMYQLGLYYELHEKNYVLMKKYYILSCKYNNNIFIRSILFNYYYTSNYYNL